MIYFISDTHFNHDREFIWEDRGFRSVDEMNQYIIDRWNATVTDKDEVYVVGDFFLGSDFDFIKETLEKLNGKIHLIRGNHDTDAKIEVYAASDKVVSIEWATQLVYNRHIYYISHYPSMTANYDTDFRRAIRNIFGHTHSTENFYNGNVYMYNVACDAHDCTPISIDQIEKEILEKWEKEREDLKF